MLGQHGEVVAGPAARRRPRGCRTPSTARHGDDGRAELPGDLVEHGGGARAAAVDLVHQDQRRNAETGERAVQDARLGLHAFDRRDDEHGPVEHVEHALDLGDEVGVAGGVDEVDGDPRERERHDRRLDRDAAAAFQRQGVGAGVAVVDAAGLVDDAREVQEALGEAGLTGVDVGEDAQVHDGGHGPSCPRGLAVRWT